MDAVSLERVLGDALAHAAPGLHVRVEAAGERPGTFRVKLGSVPINVAWLSVGWPRQVRELLLRADRPDLVAAPELSPGARSILNEAGVSWIDETGAARVTLPGIGVWRDVASGARMPRSNLGWTAGALAVCEALLTGQGGTVAELTGPTGLAPSTVALALKFLQGEHLLDAAATRGRNARRTVVDGDQLLDAYAAAAARLRKPLAVRVGVLWRDPIRGASEVGKLLTANGVRWSATGALAADVLAGYLSEVEPWELYVEGDSPAEIRQVAREVGLDEASGGRLLLRPFPTPAGDELSTTRAGIRVAVWPRVFADLRLVGVRGEDAAEHLREAMRVVP